MDIQELGRKDGVEVAAAANTIEEWLAIRDVPQLEPDELSRVLGSECADLMVVFGGGVAQAADTLAEAMRAGVAHRYAIVGGKGRATWNLRDYMRSYQREHPGVLGLTDREVEDLSEAQILDAYLHARHGLHADWLETRSTNCGNNIQFLLDRLDQVGYHPRSIILSQDAVMQRRMVATLLKQGVQRSEFHGLRIVNYAYYQAKLAWGSVEEVGEESSAEAEGRSAMGTGAETGVGTGERPGGTQAEGLHYLDPVPVGMWPVSTYLEHLASEVRRLTDDEQGYGPRGCDFLVHVDVPGEVNDAARLLEKALGGPVEYGNAAFAQPRE